jgi:prefoldin beta subunit
MVSEQTQQLLSNAQAYQQQIQGILVQKETLNLQLIEIKRALEELENSKETEVYKISGPILIKARKADAKKGLKEKKEVIDLRIKSLEKSENRLKEKFEEIKNRLEKAVTVKPDES